MGESPSGAVRKQPGTRRLAERTHGKCGEEIIRSMRYQGTSLAMQSRERSDGRRSTSSMGIEHFGQGPYDGSEEALDWADSVACWASSCRQSGSRSTLRRSARKRRSGCGRSRGAEHVLGTAARTRLRYGHLPLLVVVRVILPPEGDVIVLTGDQAMIGDCHGCV